MSERCRGHRWRSSAVGMSFPDWPTGTPMIRKEQLLDGDLIFVLHDFLSPEECEHFIALSEGAGYEGASITTGTGFVMRKDIRNNDRVIRDDPALAELLWARVLPFLPADWFGWGPVGLN